jgi:serine/threonine-protein kinase
MGTQVIVAGPDPFYADVAYHALQRVMGQLVKLRNGDPANVNDAQARRGFEEIFSMVPHGERRSAEERRLAAARALRWALEKAHESPGSERILVLIDDLHRVDCASRRAFADVMGEPPECGALFVAAHTPGFEAGWGGQRAVARVLEGLPRQIAARLFAASVSTERAAAIEDVTGNGFLPLHIDQLVRHSLEGGGDAPDRLGDLIALRVDTLEPSARRVLQALVVLGDEIEKKLLEPLLPRGFDIERSLQLLQGAGMIGRENGAQGEDVLSTTHPLLRDIVFAGTPAEVRRELHERALTVLEKNSAPTEACALHAFYAQDSFQALLLLEQVADRAAQRADLDAEVLALRRGLEIGRQEISRGELDDPLRAVLIFSRKLGESLARGGNFADAEGVLREALDIAGPAGPDRAKVLGALAHVAYGRKRSREALGYIDQAIEAARHSGARDLVSALTDTRRAWAS